MLDSTETQLLRSKLDVTSAGIYIRRSVTSIKPAWFDFDMMQGQTLSLKLSYTDEQKQIVDLSGYTARWTVRTAWDSTTNLIALTSSDGITLASAEPTITIARTAAQTAAYTFLRACHTFELIDGSSVVTRLFEGFVTLRREVAT